MELKERRNMERFAFKLPVAVKVESSTGDHRTDDLLTSNICAGGAYIKVPSPYPVGTRLDLVMRLSLSVADPSVKKKSQIKVGGAVIRTDRKGMAVSFDPRYQFIPATA